MSQTTQQSGRKAPDFQVSCAALLTFPQIKSPRNLLPCTLECPSVARLSVYGHQYGPLYDDGISVEVPDGPDVLNYKTGIFKPDQTAAHEDDGAGDITLRGTLTFEGRLPTSLAGCSTGVDQTTEYASQDKDTKFEAGERKSEEDQAEEDEEEGAELVIEEGGIGHSREPVMGGKEHRVDTHDWAQYSSAVKRPT